MEAASQVMDLDGLDALVGDWEGTGRFGDEGAEGRVTLRYHFERTAGGTGLLGIAVMEGVPDVGRIDSTDLIAWDRDDGKLHWLTICSAREALDRTGGWSGGVLEVENHRERITASRPTANTLELRWALQGGPTATFQLTRR